MMKALIVAIALAALAGCSASYNNLKFMSRGEVSEAIRYCEENHQRPVVTTAQTWFANGWVDTPVNVTCYPKTQPTYNR